MPLNPPLTGVRIRQQPGPSNGDGTNDARAWYYDRDPAVRAVVGPFIIAGTTDFTNFGVATTVILDRWCLAPGVPPYTERQVRHSALFSAAVTYTNVDGATSCRISCTLGATLTASTVSGGRATLTATATAAQGSVLFSFDNFATPGLLPNNAPGAAISYTWPDQRTGTYEVTVRETRTSGCTARATVTVTAPYGLRYEAPIRDDADTACLLRIYEREYTGAVQTVTGQPSPVLLDWPGDAAGHVFTTLLRGSSCELALLQTEPDQFLPLFSGDERLHRAEYLRAGELLWKGFLLPEQYDAPFLAPPTEINFTATDGLGTLSSIAFAGPAGQALAGDWTLLAVVQYCLGKLELGLPLHARLNLFPSTATQGGTALEQIRVDVGQLADDKRKPFDCGKVLSELLTSFQCRLYQWRGAWWLDRIRELTTTAMTYAVFDPAGVRGADLSLSRLHTVLPSTEGDLFWETAAQRQLARGAAATITATADPGELANLLVAVLPTNAQLPAAVPSGWTSATPTPTIPFSQLLYAGKDKTPLLRLIGTAAPTGGFASSVARQTAALQGAFVQTPVLPPLPLPTGKGGPHEGESLVLRLSLKAYGMTPSTVGANRSAFYVALHYGTNWLNGPAGVPTESPTLLAAGAVELSDQKEVELVISGFSTTQVGRQPVYVRLYVPAGGATATTVDITELRLEYDDALPEVADFVSTYTTDTGQLVTRTDEVALFFADTPHARYPGTLLDADALPTLGWYEPATPGQVRELGDWLVAGRNLLQRGAAQVLTGVLDGVLDGPGALLTDPSEARPGVYALGSCTHDASARTWTVRAVQLLPLVAPPEELPNYAIYNEDLTAWLSEDGRVLTYEHA